LQKPVPVAPTNSGLTKKQSEVSSSQMTIPDPLPLPKSSIRPEKSSPKAVSPSSTNPKKTAHHQKSTTSRHAHSSKHQRPAVATQPPYTPPPLEIRVGIARDAQSVTVGTSNQAFIQERAGGTLKTVSANQSLTVTPNGNSLNIGNMTVPGVAWLTPAQGSYLFVGDRWYRGRLLLVSQGNSVLAINYVDLEHYLTSVVGSEMHATAPTEALKAQAIAARSYALVHIIRPASSWFDLGDNQRWQVYKGINSEYNSGFQAVSATTGQVLSYKGGVVESLYASTDDIVATAHSGRGMSQIGAYGLAKQGYDYQQILNRYYPGVSLARVILKQ
jgi:peptidoglycan hydrolase-like amidase